MVYLIKDKKEFKEENLKNWYRNSEFWLLGKMRHLSDVYSFTADVLQNVIKSFGDREVTLVDFGCGEGWLLRLIQEYRFELNYLGIDFNVNFLDVLKKRYEGQEKIEFLLYDLEEELPSNLVRRANIATNFFNFFEIPNIETAFTNVCKSLDDEGVLIVLTIDPIMQLLAVSNNHDEFLQALKEYEANQGTLGYDKDIDVGNYKSGRIYKSILYSTAYYVELGNRNGMTLFDYKEVVKTGNFVPQIYQYILFKK